MTSFDQEDYPEFSSTEEERKYWESRGASFLSIPLVPEELSQLQIAASTAGTSPLNYARSLLHNALASNKTGTRIVDSRSVTPKSIALVQLGVNSDPDEIKSLFGNLQKTRQCAILNPPDIGYAEVEKLIQDKTAI
jgi:hypothetical protein